MLTTPPKKCCALSETVGEERSVSRHLLAPSGQLLALLLFCLAKQLPALLTP